MAFQTAPPPPCVDQLHDGLAAGDIECAHAARRRTRIAETDRDFVLEDARRAGNECGVVRIERGGAPHDRALLRIERDQAAIVRADEQPSRGVREAAHAGTGAQLLSSDLGDAGIVLPQHFAGQRIDRVHHAVTGGDIDHAIDRQRSGLRVAHVEIERPRQAQAPDRRAIDFSERAVVSLARPAPDGRPVAGVELGTQRRLICRGRHRGTNEQCSGDGETQATMNQPAAGAASGNSGAAVTRPLKSSHW